MKNEDVKSVLASEFWKEVEDYLAGEEEALKIDLSEADLTSEPEKLKAIKKQAGIQSLRTIRERISEIKNEVYGIDA